MLEFLKDLGFTKFNPVDFLNHLPYLVVGMLGILLVISIIILLTYAVNWFGVLLEKRAKEKNKE